MSRGDAIGLHKVLFAQFVKAHRRRPKRLILDFDATDIASIQRTADAKREPHQCYARR